MGKVGFEISVAKEFPMFTLFFRGALLYIVMIVTMRALGKPGV